MNMVKTFRYFADSVERVPDRPFDKRVPED